MFVGYYIECGVCIFVVYVKVMLVDFGEDVCFYFKLWYMGVKYDFCVFGFDGMLLVVDVEVVNVDMIGSEGDEF